MLLNRSLTAFALIALLCTATIVRSSVYSDEASLYADAVAKSPYKARPHNNLGDALKKAFRLSEPGIEFERALILLPDYPDALNNLATIYSSFGRKDDALLLITRALAPRSGSSPGSSQSGHDLL